MTTLSENLKSIWNKVQSSPAVVTGSVAIPRQNLTRSATGSPTIEGGKHYFAVTINELFLTTARQWFTVYDPMALVVTEFSYGGKPITVPFVVGPKLLEGKVDKLPTGMAITDTQVAGPHPYTGGKLAVTVVLAQIQRESYAHRLFKFAESVASVFPSGAQLGSYLKVAETVLGAVTSLFSMEEVVPLIGHRWEYNEKTTPWLEPGFRVLMNKGIDRIQTNRLGIVDGRLREGTADDSPYVRDVDYLLYSLSSLDSRADIKELSFYGGYEAAVRDAADIDATGWDRAKAGMLATYRDMLVSPDLTWEQAQALAAEFKQNLLVAKKNRDEFAVMGSAERASSDPTVGVLSEIPKGPGHEQRVAALRGMNELLRL